MSQSQRRLSNDWSRSVIPKSGDTSENLGERLVKGTPSQAISNLHSSPDPNQGTTIVIIFHYRLVLPILDPLLNGIIQNEPFV